MCVECAFVRSCASAAVRTTSHNQHSHHKNEPESYKKSCGVDLPCEKAGGDPRLRYARIYSILAKGVLRLAAKTRESGNQCHRERHVKVEQALKK